VPHWTVCFFAATLAVASVWVPAAAQQGDGESETSAPALNAFRIAGGTDIRLDGNLTEDLWSRAVPISDFTQQEPVEGAQPSERTEVRVVYDDQNLFIGVMAYDDP
jgi:hypothetical protein